MNVEYEVINWPESQNLIDLAGFDEHSRLICDEEGIELYGSCAYLVDSAWLSEVRGLS